MPDIEQSIKKQRKKKTRIKWSKNNVKEERQEKGNGILRGRKGTGVRWRLGTEVRLVKLRKRAARKNATVCDCYVTRRVVWERRGSAFTMQAQTFRGNLLSYTPR
jgi:hypothetical protein